MSLVVWISSQDGVDGRKPPDGYVVAYKTMYRDAVVYAPPVIGWFYRVGIAIEAACSAFLCVMRSH